MERTEKVTLYFAGEMMGNYHRVECRWAEVSLRAHAQYPSAVVAKFLPKGKRSPRAFAQTHEPNLVILAGHGHFEPAGMMEPVGSVSASGAIVTRGRHSSCSPEWGSEFRAALAAYLAANPEVKVLANFYGHNANAALAAPAGTP